MLKLSGPSAGFAVDHFADERHLVRSDFFEPIRKLLAFAASVAAGIPISTCAERILRTLSREMPGRTPPARRTVNHARGNSAASAMSCAMALITRPGLIQLAEADDLGRQPWRWLRSI